MDCTGEETSKCGELSRIDCRDYVTGRREGINCWDKRLLTPWSFGPLQITLRGFSYPNIDATGLEHCYEVRRTMRHGIPNCQKDAVKDEVADDYVTALLSLQQSITTACVVVQLKTDAYE